MSDYFRYPPESPDSALFGCSCVSVGFTRVPPGSAYPPARHPKDHQFTWRDGRILQTYTMVLISGGGGQLEYRPHGEAKRQAVPVRAGEIFVIQPGVWHRYAPDAASGWVEHWVECRGALFDELMQQCHEWAASPVIPLHGDPAVLEAFMEAHAWAAEDTPATDRALVTLGLHILTLARRAGSHPAVRLDPTGSVVRRAQSLIMLRCDQPLDTRALAQELGVGYSHFRQNFKQRTGVSPGQFHQQARHRRAEQLLANTDKPLKEISSILGFSSQYHFSKSFKAIAGLAPGAWREKIRRSVSASTVV